MRPSKGNRTAPLAGILSSRHRVGVLPQTNHVAALLTESWHVPGRVLELLEVVLVGAEVDVQFGLEVFATLGAIFPVAVVLLGMMGTTEGEASVIAEAAVPCIREQLVLVLVVADPLTAALRSDELARFSAESTARDRGHALRDAAASVGHLLRGCSPVPCATVLVLRSAAAGTRSVPRCRENVDISSKSCECAFELLDVLGFVSIDGNDAVTAYRPALAE